MFLLFLASATASPPDELVEATRRVRCERPQVAGTKKTHPGAEQFYAGAFRLSETGALTGEERRYLYANSGWKALPGLREGEDCVDIWSVVGRRVPKKDCSSCTFGLEIQADLDQARTTCVRRLTPNANHFRTLYNVREEGDGRFTLLFQSGKPFATGQRTEDGTWSWITEQTCTWF